MKNTVVSGKALEESNRRVLDSLRDFLKSIEEKQYSLVTNSHVYSLGWLDAFRLYLEKCSETPASFQKLIISSLYYLNRTSPFCIPLYLKTLVGSTDTSLDKLNPGRINSRELMTSLMSFDDSFIQDRGEELYSALCQAGSTGTVMIEPHSERETIIEIERGFQTLCKLDSFFVGILDSFQAQSCKIVVVDGAIIEVSEIHHLLEYAYQTKDSVCLIASSFSNDVSNTLLVNWEKGNTNVFPFVISDSIESINEIKDICSIIGTVPVSKDSGLRLSNIEMDDCPSKGISYDKDKDSLKIMLDESDASSLNWLRKKTQKKYESEKVDDVKVLLSKRLSKMSTRKAVIKSMFSETEKGILEDRTGAFFTYFSRCAKQGVVKDPSNTLKYLPAADVVKAVRMASYDRDALKRIKAVLRLDE